MTDRDDAELRARFAELRAYDASRVPPWWRPEVPNPRRRWPFALVAAAAIAAGIGLVYRARSSKAPPPAPGESILSWRAPTDQLLDYAASDVFGIPSLRSSLLDRFIPQAAVFKGDRP